MFRRFRRHGLFSSRKSAMSIDPAIHSDAPHAATALGTTDPLLAAVIAQVGPCRMPAPHGREPFEALLRAIAYQQLNGKAAAAILGRFVALYPDLPFPTAPQILDTDPVRMRAAGLSASKIAAIRDLCTRFAAGEVPDLAAAGSMTNEELIACLTKIRGIGRWTVEMLLIFGLGRPDVLPVDDFGVREGYRKAAGLAAQPKPAALAALGEAWAPWRSFAAWYFWRASELPWKV
jgi:DNA-3-methyladenine glycosylase II